MIADIQQGQQLELVHVFCDAFKAIMVGFLIVTLLQMCAIAIGNQY